MITPKWKKCRLVTALCCIFPAIPLISVQIDPDNRWEVRDFYNSVYTYGANAKMDWDGSYTTGNPGTLAAKWQEAVRIRINYFRSMAGITGAVELDATLDAMCQAAALMMSANDALSHDPPEDWLWWSQEGYDAARKSNLALGSNGIESVEGYMADFGDANYRAGHRRWILYPPSTVMGNGDIPGDPQAGIRPDRGDPAGYPGPLCGLAAAGVCAGGFCLCPLVLFPSGGGFFGCHGGHGIQRHSHGGPG